MLLSAAPADIAPAIIFAGNREGCVGVEDIEARDYSTYRGCVSALICSITVHQ